MTTPKTRRTERGDESAFMAEVSAEAGPILLYSRCFTRRPEAGVKKRKPNSKADAGANVRWISGLRIGMRPSKRFLKPAPESNDTGSAGAGAGAGADGAGVGAVANVYTEVTEIRLSRIRRILCHNVREFLNSNDIVLKSNARQKYAAEYYSMQLGGKDSPVVRAICHLFLHEFGSARCSVIHILERCELEKKRRV